MTTQYPQPVVPLKNASITTKSVHTKTNNYFQKFTIFQHKSDF